MGSATSCTMGLRTAQMRRDAALAQAENPRSCVDGSCIARDFCDCDGLSVQSCVRPVCVAFATGPDEVRKQGSYRLNDLGGRDLGRSVLTLG